MDSRIRREIDSLQSEVSSLKQELSNLKFEREASQLNWYLFTMMAFSIFGSAAITHIVIKFLKF